MAGWQGRQDPLLHSLLDLQRREYCLARSDDLLSHPFKQYLLFVECWLCGKNCTKCLMQYLILLVVDTLTSSWPGGSASVFVHSRLHKQLGDMSTQLVLFLPLLFVAVLSVHNATSM